MPSLADVHQYFTAVWQMMIGRQEGLKRLDLSADGFWNSFFAILVAFPPLVVGWVAVANEIAGADALGFRLSVFVRLMATDLGSWVIPFGILALAARPAGIADRFVHYVVSSNWASALFAWALLPPTLMRLFWPQAREASSAVALLLFAVTMVLSWRLTNVAVNKGPAVASAVFAAMFAASLGVLFTLEGLLGLSRPG